MWSGEITGNFDPNTGIGLASGPLKGWALCKGQTINGITIPNLTNRFIVGAGDRYIPGDQGGQDSVALTLSEMPKHNHGGGNHTHKIVAYVDALGWNGDHHFKSDKNDGGRRPRPRRRT
jgi:hypothetical protein